MSFAGEISHPLDSFWYANRAVAWCFFIYLLCFVFFYPDLTVRCAFITGHAVLVIGVRSHLTAGARGGVGVGGGASCGMQIAYLQSSADHHAVGAPIITVAALRS